MKVQKRGARFGGVFAWFGVILAVGAAGALVVQAADVKTDQLVTYYRKKANLPPQAEISVTGLAASPIKGAKQGTLEIGTPPRSRSIPFLVSEDGRYVVFGEAEDLTVDPFKKVMEKISLKGKPAKGPANAKVTIVEYSDFQCPFCSRGYATIENEVLKEYGDKVRFIYKHFPLNFHPWAEPGAIAVECAGLQNADAYWKVYSHLFERQKDITPQNLKEQVLEALAGSKIDKAKFEDCFDNKKTADTVKAEMAEGQSVGVTGTPAFIINGRLLSGAQPFQAFKNVIDDELASK